MASTTDKYPGGLTVLRPVGVLQFTEGEGPGYFAEFIARQGLPLQIIRVDSGERLPENLADFAGFCLMGGSMGVNDPFPWIDEVCVLIRKAVAQNIPLLGHCLGGQLISKALGGVVRRNPMQEIGWAEVYVEDDALGQRWLGAAAGQVLGVFQWHSDTFTIPEGATRIATNAHCANQIYVLGPHLGMQCHVEMTEALIHGWCAHWQGDVDPMQPQDGIQSVAAMCADMLAKLQRLHSLADHLYSHWCTGLRLD